MGPNAQMRHGLRAAFGNLRVRILLALTSTLIGIAALFYCLVEGWSLVDAIYFSVMTIAAVGFGDLAPQTTLGKLFTVACCATCAARPSRDARSFARRSSPPCTARWPVRWCTPTPTRRCPPPPTTRRRHRR